MLRKLRPRSAYDVMAAIAFFIAVAGGSAYAANTITGADVVDESLTGADIKGKSSPGFVDGTLDTYDIRNKSLLSSDVAANTLTAGELAPNSASVSEIKDGAVTAAKLAPLESWTHATVSRCSLSNFWEDFGGAYAAIRFRRDAFGVVHLRGGVACPDPVDVNHQFITTLPYGPKAREVFPVASSDGAGNFASGAIIEVYPDGSVIVGGHFDRHFVSLSGIEFDTLN